MATASKLACGENGQMAVELAIVAPIILVVLVIVIDMLVFAGECARFDHVAPQRVLAQAASASMDGYDARRPRRRHPSGLGGGLRQERIVR